MVLNELEAAHQFVSPAKYLAAARRISRSVLRTVLSARSSAFSASRRATFTSGGSGSTPGQNGSRGRGFGSMKYERLFLEEIPDALDLVAHAEDYRIDYNTVRPHGALAGNTPYERLKQKTQDPLS